MSAKRFPWASKPKKPPTMAEAAACGTKFKLEPGWVADVLTIRVFGVDAWTARYQPGHQPGPESYRREADLRDRRAKDKSNGKWAERLCRGTTNEQLLEWSGDPTEVVRWCANLAEGIRKNCRYPQ